MAQHFWSAERILCQPKYLSISRKISFKNEEQIKIFSVEGEKKWSQVDLPKRMAKGSSPHTKEGKKKGILEYQ